MTELSLRERLQPALLDRLVDEERMLTVFELTVGLEDLRQLGLSVSGLAAFVCANGLSARGEGASTPTHVSLRFSAPEGRVSPSQFRALTIKGAALRSFCQIDVRNELNVNAESPEQRYTSQRRLREYVCRDLAMLLNSTSIESSYDLSALAHVHDSVLNYGMPSLAGRAPKSVDLASVARSIEKVIRRFEPRLSHVRVVPDVERSEDDHHFYLRIEAQLWGQPMPQHLVLRTRISTDSGDVSVSESGAP